MTVGALLGAATVGGVSLVLLLLLFVPKQKENCCLNYTRSAPCHLDHVSLFHV